MRRKISIVLAGIFIVGFLLEIATAFFFRETAAMSPAIERGKVEPIRLSNRRVVYVSADEQQLHRLVERGFYWLACPALVALLLINAKGIGRRTY
jgi:hypothetical protein